MWIVKSRKDFFNDLTEKVEEVGGVGKVKHVSTNTKDTQSKVYYVDGIKCYRIACSVNDPKQNKIYYKWEA